MTTKDGASVSNDEKLKVYALYKQVTVGECAEHGGSQPWAVQVANRAKWDAWKAVEGKPYSWLCRRCNAAAATPPLPLPPPLLAQARRCLPARRDFQGGRHDAVHRGGAAPAGGILLTTRSGLGRVPARTRVACVLCARTMQTTE